MAAARATMGAGLLGAATYCKQREPCTRRPAQDTARGCVAALLPSASSSPVPLLARPRRNVPDCSPAYVAVVFFRNSSVVEAKDQPKKSGLVRRHSSGDH
eukprot:5180776-Prymnesium_polylepis.1